MKNLLHYDGPLIRFLEGLGEFIITNLLTILCCIPVITVGCAFAGHQKVMQNMVMDNHQPVLRTYFFTMWNNFRQATVLWILFLVSVVLLALDFFFVYIFTSGVFSLVLFALLVIITAIVLGVTACCFSLIVRYENKLKEHLRNALFLVISHWPRILGMALVLVSPLLIAIVNFPFFFNIVPFWMIIGISVLVYAQARLVKPIFEHLETSPDIVRTQAASVDIQRP